MKEKSYDELDFTDDFLFCRIMMENEDLCIEMAEMITGKTLFKGSDRILHRGPDWGLP